MIGLLLDAHSVVARDAGSFGVAMPAEPNAVTRVAELVHLSQRIPSYASVTDALANGQRNDSIVIHLKRPTAVEA